MKFVIYFLAKKIKWEDVREFTRLWKKLKVTVRCEE
jgi:hypothetical protein